MDLSFLDTSNPLQSYVKSLLTRFPAYPGYKGHDKRNLMIEIHDPLIEVRRTTEEWYKLFKMTEEEKRKIRDEIKELSLDEIRER